VLLEAGSTSFSVAELVIGSRRRLAAPRREFTLSFKARQTLPKLQCQFLKQVVWSFWSVGSRDSPHPRTVVEETSVKLRLPVLIHTQLVADRGRLLHRKQKC